MPAFRIALFCLMAIPYGISNSIISTVMPFRLRSAAFSVEAIGVIFALMMAPAYLQFLYAPIVDWKYSKKTWILITSCLMAVCFAIPERLADSPQHAHLMLGLILLGQFLSSLMMNCVGGLIAQCTDGRTRDLAASWKMAGYLAGNALGASLGLGASGQTSTLSSALALGGMALVPGLLVLLLPTPAPVAAAQSASLFGELRDLGHDRQFWFTMLLALSPSCAAGLMSLFPAVAADFHATPQDVVLANGAAGSLAMVLGSSMAGWLTARSDRHFLYVACSAALAAIALAMCLSPLSPAVYLLGVLSYNVVIGIAYAVFSVIAMRLIDGNSRFAATKYSLFFSVSNLPVAYVALIDSRFHQHYGVRSVFLVDALLNVTGIALCALLWRRTAHLPLQPARSGV